MRVAPHPCPCQILYHYRPPSPPRRLSIAHNSRQETCESRRDCIVQPRVARHELPWEDHVKSASTPTGLHRRCPRVDTTPLGLTGHSNILTQGSSCLATLGLKIESLRDSRVCCLELWVMLSTRRQRGWPQAGRGEPADCLRGVGISRLAAGGVGFAPGMMESSRL